MANDTTQDWGFYGRATEQAELEKIISSGRWFFCAISGRRRIGKTTLIQKAIAARPDLKAFYFQVPDSDERGVVQTFQDALEDSGVPSKSFEHVRTFSHMVVAIETLCKCGVIVIIDEFQYFHRKALSPFSSFLQLTVDRLRDTKTGGLFVLGSIHTEMTAVLEDRTSPLFNRVTHRIKIGHWDFATLFEMFDAHGIENPTHRLFLWSLFEGVPKFYRDCFEAEVLKSQENARKETLGRLFFKGTSPLRDEATNWFLYQGAMIETHRDGFPWFSARRVRRRDAAHRKTGATTSESLGKPPPAVASAYPRSASESLTDALHRPRLPSFPGISGHDLYGSLSLLLGIT